MKDQATKIVVPVRCEDCGDFIDLHRQAIKDFVTHAALVRCELTARLEREGGETAHTLLDGLADLESELRIRLEFSFDDAVTVFGKHPKHLNPEHLEFSKRPKQRHGAEQAASPQP